MRIVSLSPAATEWIVAFGGGEELVGRSHACDHPSAVQALPEVTVPATGAVAVDLLRKLRPDVVVLEEGILPAFKHALQQVGATPTVMTVGGETYKKVLDAALRLARGIGRMPAGLEVVGAGERRLALLRAALGLEKRMEGDDLPAVGVVTDAPRPVHRRLHDQVGLAGGRLVAGATGEGFAVEWAAVAAADPELLCILPAVPGMAEALALAERLERQDGWRSLRAVRTGRIHLFDGVFFHRPGPRLYRGVELLATALYPQASAGIALAADEAGPLGK